MRYVISIGITNFNILVQLMITCNKIIAYVESGVIFTLVILTVPKYSTNTLHLIKALYGETCHVIKINTRLIQYVLRQKAISPNDILDSYKVWAIFIHNHLPTFIYFTHLFYSFLIMLAKTSFGWPRTHFCTAFWTSSLLPNLFPRMWNLSGPYRWKSEGERFGLYAERSKQDLPTKFLKLITDQQGRMR